MGIMKITLKLYVKNVIQYVKHAIISQIFVFHVMKPKLEYNQKIINVYANQDINIMRIIINVNNKYALDKIEIKVLKNVHVIMDIIYHKNNKIVLMNYRKAVNVN